MSLQGKVALVTGAGTGIGQGIAIALAAEGAKVAIHYNSSSAGAEKTKEKISELNGESTIIKADVSKQDQINRMVQEVLAQYGRIDILVNNAALQLNTSLFDYTSDKYDLMMNINLKGYMQCMQAVIPAMKKEGFGRIINISSVHGKRPTDFDVVYSMTKGGIKMLTREAAIELSRYGITVNTVEPGYIDVGPKSGTTKPIIPKENRKQLERREVSFERLPLHRNPLPEDVGPLICYIASEGSEILTGSSIRLDGGTMLV